MHSSESPLHEMHFSFVIFMVMTKMIIIDSNKEVGDDDDVKEYKKIPRLQEDLKVLKTFLFF